MTHKVGIRELKNRTTQIVRDVREHSEEYIVTLDGVPVARMIPIEQETPQTLLQRKLDVLKRIDEVAEAVSERWPSKVSAAQAVSEQRR